jgi:hypothetical protein
MVNTELRDWIIKNKIVVYCETTEEAVELLKMTVNYDLSSSGRVKEEIFIASNNDWSWQDGYNKGYFIKHKRAKQCIDFKDLPFIKTIYELW